MASKTEYYLRVIASLQSEITSLKTGQSEVIKEIKALKSTVARQQKEIEALKASQDGDAQKSSEHQQKWITTENLLLAVKRVCDDVIRGNNEQLPTMFANRQEFENFRKSIEQKFLPFDSFTAYQKSQETHLKSIEEKLGCRFSLLTINHLIQKCNNDSKRYFKVKRFFKDFEFRGCLPYITLVTIIMLALFILATIKN